MTRRARHRLLAFRVARLELLEERRGIEAPHNVVNRLICSKLVIGMMPAMIGTSTPYSRARSRNVK
jgi:hypothetical protein